MQISLHNLANSCYADSALIFILVYHEVPFFRDNFYTSTKNNWTQYNDVQGLSDEFYNTEFNIDGAPHTEKEFVTSLRTLLDNMKSDIEQNIQACKNRNKFRLVLQYIWARNKDILKKKITNLGAVDNWTNSQLEASDLFQYLIYLFNCLPHDIILKPYSGFRYDINNPGKKLALTHEELSKHTTDKTQIPGLINRAYATDTDEVPQSIQTLDSIDYTKFKMPSTEGQSTLLYPADTNLHKLMLTTILPNELQPNVNIQNLTPEIQKAYSGLINRDIVKFNKWTYDDDNKVFVNYVCKKDLPIIFININRIIRHQNGNKALSLSPIEMTEYITNPVTKTKYILIGGTIHGGTVSGGHYTAYIRDPEDDKFYYYNDSGSTITQIGNYTQLLQASPNISTNSTTLIYIKEEDYTTQKNYTLDQDEYYNTTNNSNSQSANSHQQPATPPQHQTQRFVKPDPAKINFIQLG